MQNIIVDLDGTIANIEHRLHFIKQAKPKDWIGFFEACSEDSPEAKVIDFIKNICLREKSELSLNVYIMSGRSEIVRQKTEEWLEKHFPIPHALYMRVANDFRKDDIIKSEMAEKANLTPKNTLCVIDDRSSVVEMWRKRGFLCFQVADHSI